MIGNAIIGQSGGPTSVINSTLVGVIKASLESTTINKMYGMHYGIEGFMAEDLLSLDTLSEEVLSGLRNTPSSALGSSRHKLQEEDFPQIMKVLKKYDIRYFFLIGGNDTMDTVHRIEKYCQQNNYEMVGIGIPKTVDNDLFGTDHTPGFASAARFNALSVKQSGVLTHDMQRVDKFVIYQTIGRDAGWLAAATALARDNDGDAPHLIYCPEIKFNKNQFIEDAKACVEKYGWVSIVVSEGLLFEDGTPVSASESKDRFNNIEFGAMGGGSAGMSVHRILSDATGWRGEFQVTESLNMCAIDRAVPNDLEEAYSCGLKAVELAEDGISGVMVTILRESNTPYTISYGTIPLKDVAIRAKSMDRDMFNKKGNDITEKGLEYLRPLIGELPHYVKLEVTNE